MKASTIIKALKLFKNSNSVLPILECAFLNKSKVVLTDLETFVIIPFKTGIKQCVYADHLITALTEFKEPVFTEDKNRKVFISEGKQKISLMGEDPNNFPKTAGEDRGNYSVVGNISAAQIPLLLEALQFASNDDLRPAMTTVQLHTHIAATDAHRLVMHPLETPFTEDILLTKRVVKLIEIFGGDWTFELSNFEIPQNKTDKPNLAPIVCLKNTDGVKIYHRMIESKFPQWKVVVPETNTKTPKVIINTKELRKAIKLGIKFANKCTNQCNITLKDGVLNFHTQDVDFGFEYDTSFPAKFKQEISIAFNAKFLDEFAAKCGDEMTVTYSTPTKAIIIDKKYLLMPLMLNN